MDIFDTGMIFLLVYLILTEQLAAASALVVYNYMSRVTPIINYVSMLLENLKDFNLSASLAAKGKKVLMIDGDMQLNLTLSFFPEDEALGFVQSGDNLYTAIKKQQELTPYIRHTAYEGLDLIPSSILMSGIEVDLFTMWQREFILKQGLAKIRESGEYDYILIDAPPTLGCWVMNIMCASDYLIIPVEASPWGLFGLANMFEFLNTTSEIAPDLQIMGIAITKVDERKNYFRQTLETLQELEDMKVFKSHIHVDSSIEWSQDNSKPVLVYKKTSRSAKEYMELAKEVETLCQ